MSEITKRALAQALKDLMNEKPLSKITITDITDKVGVSRHTFYYHFQDVFSLIMWILEEESEREIGSNTTITTWAQGFSLICEYVLENKKFIIGIYRSEGKELVTAYLRRKIHDVLLEIVEGQVKHYRVSEREKEMVADFYSYAITGIVLNWVDHNMEEDYHFMQSTMERILQGEVSDALQRLSH